MALMSISIKKHCRLNPEPHDGTRLLVMRYWPRGCSRDQFDQWLPELAPSSQLLSWIKAQYQLKNCDPHFLFESWRDRYIAEMETQAGLITALKHRHENGEDITLLCSCHAPDQCHRTILRNLILGIRG